MVVLVRTLRHSFMIITQLQPGDDLYLILHVLFTRSLNFAHCFHALEVIYDNYSNNYFDTTEFSVQAFMSG